MGVNMMEQFFSILNISWEFVHSYWPIFAFFLGFFFTRRLKNNKTAIVIPLPQKKELVIEEEGAFDEASQTSDSVTTQNLITTTSQSEVPVLESPLEAIVTLKEEKKKVLTLSSLPISLNKKSFSLSSISSPIIISPTTPNGIANRTYMRTKSRMGSKLL